MHQEIIEQIIKQELQLLARIEPPTTLAALIDDEFIEIGSSSVGYDKTEVIRWLECTTPSTYTGSAFKACPLAENIILLTYISTNATGNQAARSSIWRLSDGQWRMVFHQGTPLKQDAIMNTQPKQ